VGRREGEWTGMKEGKREETLRKTELNKIWGW
jgi:hypothetical protein